jgi:hypothetical protein
MADGFEVEGAERDYRPSGQTLSFTMRSRSPGSKSRRCWRSQS